MTDHFETVICISAVNEESRYFLLRYEVFGESDEEMKGEPEYYIPYASIKIREISESESDKLEDETLDRDNIGTAVCTLNGWLIMSNFMRNDGYDPHYLCDAHSQDVEYCWSALTDPSISALSLFDNQGNIYYVDSIDIEPAYQPENDKTGIIVGLLANILHFVNDIVTEEELMADREKQKRMKKGGTSSIDTIAFYPQALPYDNSMQQKQTDMACSIVSEIRAKAIEQMLNSDSMIGQDGLDVSLKVAPELYMRAAGMRVSGDTYPESAKKRKEWDLLEEAGWYECGNSRLLYKTINDD